MTYEEPVDPELRKCYLHGTTYSTAKQGSVAVSVCDGLTGLIHHQNEFIFIEPVHEEFHSVKKLRAKYHRTLVVYTMRLKVPIHMRRLSLEVKFTDFGNQQCQLSIRRVNPFS